MTWHARKDTTAAARAHRAAADPPPPAPAERWTVHKTIVCAVTMLGQLEAAEFFTGREQVIVSAALAVAGVFGVWRVPNRRRH